jgi:hypothetical protein
MRWTLTQAHRSRCCAAQPVGVAAVPVNSDTSIDISKGRICDKRALRISAMIVSFKNVGIALV